MIYRKIIIKQKNKMKAFESYTVPELTILLYYFELVKEISKIVLVLSGGVMFFGSDVIKILGCAMFIISIFLYVREIEGINLVFQARNEKMLKE